VFSWVTSFRLRQKDADGFPAPFCLLYYTIHFFSFENELPIFALPLFLSSFLTFYESFDTWDKQENFLAKI